MHEIHPYGFVGPTFCFGAHASKYDFRWDLLSLGLVLWNVILDEMANSGKSL